LSRGPQRLLILLLLLVARLRGFYSLVVWNGVLRVRLRAIGVLAAPAPPGARWTVLPGPDRAARVVPVIRKAPVHRGTHQDTIMLFESDTGINLIALKVNVHGVQLDTYLKGMLVDDDMDIYITTTNCEVVPHYGV
jgi:hypothetical protein